MLGVQKVADVTRVTYVDKTVDGEVNRKEKSQTLIRTDAVPVNGCISELELGEW